MCLVYTTWMSCRGKNLITVLRARGLRYLLLALIDVEACTLATSSHQFISLDRIQVRPNDITRDFNLAFPRRTVTKLSLSNRLKIHFISMRTAKEIFKWKLFSSSENLHSKLFQLNESCISLYKVARIFNEFTTKRWPSRETRFFEAPVYSWRGAQDEAPFKLKMYPSRMDAHCLPVLNNYAEALRFAICARLLPASTAVSAVN